MMKKHIMVLLGGLFLSFGGLFVEATQSPAFGRDFSDHLINPSDNNAEHTADGFYALPIDPNQPLSENIKRLFYPSSATNGGLLWKYVRTIGVGVFFLFLFVIGAQFLMNGDDEGKVDDAKKHFLWLAYGAFLYFGAVWILGFALQVTTPGGSNALVDNFQNNLWLQLLSFFKAVSFFAAIVAMVRAGYKLMNAMGHDDQLAAAKTGIVNVLIALALMKVIDFVYVLAMDPGFFDEASALILKISRILGYVIGVGILGSIFVAGYQFITDGGSGEGAEKAGKTLKTVFIVGLTIFLFLLIVYQVIAQFG